MKKLGFTIITIIALLSQKSIASLRFSETLCQDPDYYCIKVRAHETWDNLFPNYEKKDLVRRINRMNIPLRAGIIIAIPRNLERLTLYDLSPFPRYIRGNREKTIFISQEKLAFGAYDENGELIWWGPISSGTFDCKTLGGCSTPTGDYRIIRKQDDACISTTFPRRGDGYSGGAAMPYCMHFFRGYALHGSEDLPGYPASHGCIRLFTEDARWLNEEFIDLPGGGVQGTRIVIDDLHQASSRDNTVSDDNY